MEPWQEPEVVTPEVRALLDAGWEVWPVSCYDEEGVEGWQWHAPEGHPLHLDELVEIGGWDEAPPLPEELADTTGHVTG